MFSISPLLTGVRNPYQGIMTYQQGYGQRIWLPVWSFLVQNDQHNVLIDTGLDENELFVPPQFTEDTGLEADTLVNLLAAKGLVPDDIDIVVNTHLHDDHCGNNALFTQAQHYTHPLEISFCKDPHPLDHRYDDYFIEDIHFNEIEEGEIVPGLKVFHSPGHTLGTLSVEIETKLGPAIILVFVVIRKIFQQMALLYARVFT